MKIEVKYFHVLTGKSFNGKEIVPTGTIEVLVNGQPVSASATGNGPVNALYNAVNKLDVVKGHEPYLRRFDINSSADGSDATGQANVTVIDRGPVTHSGAFYRGTAASTDIVEAALLAYVGAINKMLDASTTEKP